MLYLERFSFPGEDEDFSIRHGDYRAKMTCYDSMYPFGVLSRCHLGEVEFSPITIFYGGNGSGKTTALNVIAEKLMLDRDTLFNRSEFFDDYLKYCHYDACAPIPSASRIITSDDVFDYMLNIRMINNGLETRREELFADYWRDRKTPSKVQSLDDYDNLRKINLARRKTPSQYIRSRMMDTVREQSNGESAGFYFISRIRDDALYLLDEPENSLSPARQQELVEYIENQARFFHCQFVIATHSPFLLALKDAKIYDLDSDPACVRRWTELPTVRAYYDFFMKHRTRFDG